MKLSLSALVFVFGAYAQAETFVCLRIPSTSVIEAQIDDNRIELDGGVYNNIYRDSRPERWGAKDRVYQEEAQNPALLAVPESLFEEGQGIIKMSYSDDRDDRPTLYDCQRKAALH